MTHRRATDAGFGVLELVVALAIASLVTVAIGGLFVLSLTIYERGEEAQEVQTALLDLQSVARLASRGIDLQITEPGSEGFALVSADERVARVSVQLAQSTLVLLINDQPVARADLSVFGARSLQYLVATQDTVRWSDPTSLGGAQPMATRLRLALHQRVWRPLIWLPQPEAL